MTDLIENQLLPAALTANISIFDFWNMTIKEIQAVMKVYMENKQLEQKQARVNVYNIAYLTSMFVGLILGGKHVPPFSDVFPDDMPADVTQDRADIEAAVLADKMRDFARQRKQNRRN